MVVCRHWSCWAISLPWWGNTIRTSVSRRRGLTRHHPTLAIPANSCLIQGCRHTCWLRCNCCPWFQSYPCYLRIESEMYLLRTRVFDGCFVNESIAVKAICDRPSCWKIRTCWTRHGFVYWGFQLFWRSTIKIVHQWFAECVAEYYTFPRSISQQFQKFG